MPRDRAEYMRSYRLRQRSEQIKNTTMPSEVVADLLAAQDRIRELQGEVARLKRDLAARPVARPTAATPAQYQNDPSMRGYGQYRPAPKR